MLIISIFGLHPPKDSDRVLMILTAGLISSKKDSSEKNLAFGTIS
nr:MAG TPA: hypothetical protein [Caudoviricetes sp.]